MSLANRLLGRHGTGWRQDDPDRRDYDVDLLALASSRTASCSLRRFSPAVLNQGATNSCVAQAFSAAIAILEMRSDLAYAPVSRRFLYYNARRAHGAQLQDQGTHLRHCAKMMNRVGVPDEKYMPWKTDAVSIRVRPGFGPIMQAHPRRGGEFHRIFDVGEQRLQAVRAAIDAGLPIAFGTDVSREFLSNGGDELISTPDFQQSPKAGGHAMLIVGYGPGYFEVQNSWGTRWRDGGYARLDNDYIAWNRSRDFQIISGWGRLQDAA